MGIIGKKFGLTDFVNPKDHEKPTEAVLLEMTGGLGLDYTFECCGIPSCMVNSYITFLNPKQVKKKS